MHSLIVFRLIATTLWNMMETVFFICPDLLKKSCYFTTATLPFNEVPAIVSEQRQKELEQRKLTYQWDYVSDDMPGNIKATTHDDLPRDVQFTDEKSRYTCLFVYCNYS